MTNWIVLVNDPNDMYHPYACQFHNKDEAEAKCKYEQERGRTATLTRYVGSFPKKEKKLVKV